MWRELLAGIVAVLLILACTCIVGSETEGVETLLELFTQTELVPDGPVYAAEDHANHQYPEDDLVDAHCDSRVRPVTC